MDLKKARAKSQVDAFIREHEADPEGDLDKLDALFITLKVMPGSPFSGSGSRNAVFCWDSDNLPAANRITVVQACRSYLPLSQGKLWF